MHVEHLLSFSALELVKVKAIGFENLINTTQGLCYPIFHYCKELIIYLIKLPYVQKSCCAKEDGVLCVFVCVCVCVKELHFHPGHYMQALNLWNQ